jgi:hypothetical protein
MIANRDNLPRVFIKDNIYAVLDVVTARSARVGELLVEHDSLEREGRQGRQHQECQCDNGAQTHTHLPGYVTC